MGKLIYKTSHSKTKLARKCLKAYKYKYILKLRKRVKSRPLLVGSLVHECIESYFRNGYYMPVIKEWRAKEFKKMFKEEQALHGDIIPLVKTLVRGYIQDWKSRNWNMLWVEKEFEVEIAPGIVLVGKIDGRAEDNRGRQWLVEHKTCKKMPGEDVRLNDIQILIYAGVLPQIDEDPVSGVIWDYIRTKLPARPELLAKGGLSKRKNIDTTKEVYLREIKKHGYDVEGYEDILEELDSRKDSFYREVKLPIKQQMVNTAVQELVITAEMVKELERDFYETGADWFVRNLTRDCSWCDYQPLCHAEFRGDDTEYLLKHDYVRKENAEEKVEFDLEPG